MEGVLSMSILQTIDLKKYYGTKPNITRALDGVNFSVNDGEFVAVVGTFWKRRTDPASHDGRAGHSHDDCPGQNCLKMND